MSQIKKIILKKNKSGILWQQHWPDNRSNESTKGCKNKKQFLQQLGLIGNRSERRVKTMNQFFK